VRLFIFWLTLGVLLCQPIAAVVRPTRLPSRYERPIASGGQGPALLQEAVPQIVNAERRRSGRKPLASVRRLARAAADHAADMPKPRAMTHRLPDLTKGRPAQRLAGNGVRFRRAGENIGTDKAFRLPGRQTSRGDVYLAKIFGG
jgi:uncharacterized protein YkwD